MALWQVLHKCQILRLGRRRARGARPQDLFPPDHLDVGLGLVPVVPRLRFLGVGVAPPGRFEPWRTPSDTASSLGGMLSRLGRLGFSVYPAAVTAAL